MLARASLSLLEVVDFIYEVVGREDALRPMLAHLAALFDCPSAALVYLDAGRPAANVAQPYGRFDEEAAARYQADFAAIDPAPAAFARLSFGEAAATDRLFTLQERESSRFLNEFYRPLGLCEALGAPITSGGGRYGLVAVHRGPERPPFEDEEIANFATLARHVGRAVDLRRRFFLAEDALARLEGALDNAGSAMALLDQQGRLEHANAAARALIADGEILLVHRSGQIGSGAPEAARRLRAVFAAPASTAKTELIAGRSRSGERYGLRLAPNDGSTGWRLHVATAQPHEAPDLRAADIFRQVLELTPSAAKLVAALVAGADLATYAAQSGLTLNTAKFHLKAAFKATGARRQAELVRLAAGLLRDLCV